MNMRELKTAYIMSVILKVHKLCTYIDNDLTHANAENNKHIEVSMKLSGFIRIQKLENLK